MVSPAATAQIIGPVAAIDGGPVKFIRPNGHPGRGGNQIDRDCERRKERKPSHGFFHNGFQSAVRTLGQAQSTGNRQLRPERTQGRILVPPPDRGCVRSICLAWWNSSRCDEWSRVQRRNDFGKPVCIREAFRLCTRRGCRSATTATAKQILSEGPAAARVDAQSRRRIPKRVL